jgi:hypothetical protein
MKLLKSPQKTLIIFLTSIIIVSFFFIVRLEIKAAELQTQWEKHQESLKANSDVLEGLERFYRFAGLNLIKMDVSGISLISGTKQSLQSSWLEIQSKSISITTEGSIEIEAKEDISIKSLNGDVNINGKKVNLNE